MFLRLAPRLHFAAGWTTGFALSTAMDDLSLRILSYLADNPEANDTAEGIVHWWLLEREIRDETARIERSLSDLVAGGWLIETQGADRRVRYRMNLSKAPEIQTLIQRRVP